MIYLISTNKDIIDLILNLFQKFVYWVFTNQIRHYGKYKNKEHYTL